jgi:hypothetical protein
MAVVTIPERLFEAAKQAADREGLSVDEFIADAVVGAVASRSGHTMPDRSVGGRGRNPEIPAGWDETLRLIYEGRGG